MVAYLCKGKNVLNSLSLLKPFFTLLVRGSRVLLFCYYLLLAILVNNVRYRKETLMLVYYANFKIKEVEILYYFE